MDAHAFTETAIMTSLSRRSFVRGMAAMPFALWLAQGARASTPYIRYDIGTPEGQDMIRVLAYAVRYMKSRSAQDPRGWQWQWYTHFVNGATTKSNEINRIFGTTSTWQSALAQEMWNTCQSHAGQNANHFLPWHRMFVFFFEQIVREVAKRPDFTLPYWNYTSYDPAKRGVLPQEFRMPSDPSDLRFLYRSDRTSLANSGQPIHKNQPGDAMDITVAMAKENYSSTSGVQGFCRAIDSGIHGRIHVLVGTSTNMGAVPYAGKDPLFWVHHANIDRLWASWNRNGGLNPSIGSWLDNVFVFADHTGQRVTGTLREFFDMDALGYTYDRFVAADGTETTTQIAARSNVVSIGAVAERIALAASAQLGERPVRTELMSEAGKPPDALDPTRQRRTYLVVKDLHTWKQPEVLFHLYLAPRGGGLNPATYVGNINFFDAEFHDHGNGAMGDALGENFYSFDVTSLLQRLESRRGSGPAMPLDITFVPGGRPTPGAKPLVGSIQLVWQ